MNLLSLLWFKGSRKAGLGIWLFIVANAYLVMKLISADQWFAAIGLASILLGGGTAFDRWIETKKPPTP